MLNPQYVDDIEDVAQVVGPILGIEKDKLVQKFEKSARQNGPYAQVKLKDNLSRDELFRLKRIRLDTPGLDVRETVLRSYPMKENGAQLFGYVGEISKKQIPAYKSIVQRQIEFRARRHHW